jgi:hypothetical protein
MLEHMCARAVRVSSPTPRTPECRASRRPEKLNKGLGVLPVPARPAPCFAWMLSPCFTIARRQIVASWSHAVVNGGVATAGLR